MRRRLILQETGLSRWRFFISYFIGDDTFYLFLNWFSKRVSDDWKYVCGRRLYTCIYTRKFKGLNSRAITSLLEIKKKSDLQGTSFQSSPKINRMLITRPIFIQWKFKTHNPSQFCLLRFLFFFDHSVVFTSSEVIRGPTRFGKALNLIFPKLSSQKNAWLRSSLVARVLSHPSLRSERERDPGWVWSRGSRTKLIRSRNDS